MTPHLALAISLAVGAAGGLAVWIIGRRLLNRKAAGGAA